MVSFFPIDPIFCHGPLSVIYIISTKPFILLSGRLQFGKVVYEG
jgi:hypothetical protein